MKEIIIIFFLITSLYANANENENENFEIPNYPLDLKKYKSNTPKIVKSIRYQKFDIESKKTNNIYKRLIKAQDIIDTIYDIDISQEPEIRVFKTIDTLYMHPKFLYTILLPNNYVINEAIPSFETTVFSKGENKIKIQPKKMFHTGNIILDITKDNKINYTMSITIKNYTKKIINKIKKEENIKDFTKKIMNIVANDNLFLVIKYVENQKIDNKLSLKILQTYNKIKKTKKDFEKNGDYQKIHLNKYQMFYIIRDDEYGNWYLKNTKVRISTVLN